MHKPILRSLLCLLLLTLQGQANALLRDNNQIFEVAELAVIKIVLLAPYSGITLRSIDIPEFKRKKAGDLYATTADAYAQLRRLHRNFGVGSIAPLTRPETPVGEADVYDLLERINEGLDVLLEQRGLERPLGPESVVGKSADINYARLWYLTQVMAEMLAPPDTRSIQAQLAFVKAALDTIARKRKLKNGKVSKQPAVEKTARDVMLVAYQNLHLLGRLQRRFSIKPVRPGTVMNGPAKIGDIYEVTRSTVANLHQTRLSLGLPGPAPFVVVSEAPSFGELYGSMRNIHNQLIAMTGSKPI